VLPCCAGGRDRCSRPALARPRGAGPNWRDRAARRPPAAPYAARQEGAVAAQLDVERFGELLQLLNQHQDIVDLQVIGRAARAAQRRREGRHAGIYTGPVEQHLPAAVAVDRAARDDRAAAGLQLQHDFFVPQRLTALLADELPEEDDQQIKHESSQVEALLVAAATAQLPL
jgi:hypothetical protein